MGSTVLLRVFRQCLLPFTSHWLTEPDWTIEPGDGATESDQRIEMGGGATQRNWIMEPGSGATEMG